MLYLWIVMRHSQLRAFYLVAIHGGFSAAARAQNMTQPALSDQVRKLEAAHDVRLFDRSGKRVRLTKEGKALLAIVRPMFEIEARAWASLRKARALPAGELRIIADSTCHLTGILRLFRSRHGQVRIRLRSGNSRQVVKALKKYAADIGVTGDAGFGPGFDAIGLGESPIIAFAAKDFSPMPGAPVSFAALSRLPLVMRESGSKTRQKVEAAARAAGVTLHASIEAQGREAVRDMVAGGAGIGFVSTAEFAPDPRLVGIPLPSPAPMMAETMIALSQRRDVAAIRAFMACGREFVHNGGG